MRLSEKIRKNSENSLFLNTRPIDKNHWRDYNYYELHMFFYCNHIDNYIYII